MAPKVKPKVPAISAAKLGPLVGLSERQTSRILAQYDTPKIHRGGYEQWPAIRNLLQHFKTEAEALDEGAKRDKAAILANDRRQSDLKTSRLLGETIPTAEAIAVVQPVAMAIRQRILASGMSATEKQAVLSDLAAMEAIDWKAKAKDSGA